MKRNTATLALVFLIVIMAHAAGGKREEAADAAAQKWLAGIDRGQYGESWDGASNAFKGAVTRQKWQDALAAVRQPLGDLTTRTYKNAEYKTNLPGAPDGEYVVLMYTTVFANKKDSTETVTMVLESGGAWKSAGYFIR